MTDQDKTPMLGEEGSPPCNDRKMDGSGDHRPSVDHRVIECPNIGSLNVYVQGTRSSSEVVILTVHDLGCDHSMYYDFIGHEAMENIRGRTVWVHVDVPGQSQDAPDLPHDYEFPTMQKLGEDLIHVLDTLKIREVVCFGEGAGANILARFAVAHQPRVLGVVLLHCTGTTAGFMESMKDKLMNWKLDHIGMNPTAEAYLVLHRFGSVHNAKDKDLKCVIENYQSTLKKHVNPKNLKKFVEAFLKRTNIADNSKKLECPLLFVTGSKSVFSGTTHAMHQTVMKNTQDKGKIDLLEIGGCANVLEENPRKFIESLQYFLQGLGLVSSIPMQKQLRMPYQRSASMEEYDLPMSVRRTRTTSVSSIPMQHLKRMQRMRSMSMEEYDMPKVARQRTVSGGNSGTESPLVSTTPPAQQVAN